MLLDIGRGRAQLSSSSHPGVADAHFVTGLALVQVRRNRLGVVGSECMLVQLPSLKWHVSTSFTMLRVKDATCSSLCA